jgi:hypothetical protein
MATRTAGKQNVPRKEKPYKEETQHYKSKFHSLSA